MRSQALANNSPAGRFHQIDGVVLTKFDTIDTKVRNADDVSHGESFGLHTIPIEGCRVCMSRYVPEDSNKHDEI